MMVNAKHWLEQFEVNAPDILLNHVQLDSRKVGESDVFLAIEGVQSHGKLFIAKALEQGAALVLTDEGSYSDDRIIVVANLKEKLPQMVASFYNFPANTMQLIGITGTNGKSSTAFFVNQLAELVAEKAGVIGTLGYGHYQSLTALPNTTPHFVDLQKILAQFKAQGITLAAMEVSSHALVQERVAGLNFNVAVFTNLTRDHLDYHHTMEEYGSAKARLFEAPLSKNAVINVSDAFGKALAKQVAAPVLVYGKLEDCHEFSNYLAYSAVIALDDGYQCKLSSHLGQYSLKLPLLGEFNIQNVLAAIAAMHQLGYSLDVLIKAASKLHAVPGRMEQFMFEQGFVAVIDYAHTPDALEQALKSLRLHCKGLLWCVFGCGGDRDKGKRPLMGQIAELYSDHVVITSDNPRSEDAMSICEDIAKGMSPDGSYQIELTRTDAIKLALINAQAGDIVLIAGKGHETDQIIGTEIRHYDERAYLKKMVVEFSA